MLLYSSLDGALLFHFGYDSGYCCYLPGCPYCYCIEVDDCCNAMQSVCFLVWFGVLHPGESLPYLVWFETREHQFSISVRWVDAGC